jgi:molecular chaperone IbpA
MTSKSFVPAFFAKDAFKDFDKFFLDFDGQIGKMQQLHNDMAKNIPNYPPFNVRKVDEKNYVIEIAVAGFATHEIEVELDGGKLTVKGNSTSEKPTDYIFNGIATRAFTRTWAIGDEYKVENAELLNGILKIALERLIPEAKKPVKVPVKTAGEKQFLKEGQ